MVFGCVCVWEDAVDAGDATMRYDKMEVHYPCTGMQNTPDKTSSSHVRAHVGQSQGYKFESF